MDSGPDVAGLATRAVLFLVWTGIALALRRFLSWRKAFHSSIARRPLVAVNTM